MKKYKTGGRYIRVEIEEVEISRETEKCVFLIGHRGQGRRENKEGEWANYFDTWEAAQAYLLMRAERDVEAARLALDRTKGLLGNVKGMKKPA